MEKKTFLYNNYVLVKRENSAHVLALDDLKPTSKKYVQEYTEQCKKNPAFSLFYPDEEPGIDARKYRLQQGLEDVISTTIDNLFG